MALVLRAVLRYAEERMLFVSLAFSFFVIWLCSGIIVGNVQTLARVLRIPPFVLSLFLLGTATSVPEISVTALSLFHDTAQISLGTLIGGQMYILFGIIPILALCLGKVRIHDPLQKRTVFLFLLVVGLPLFAVIDQHVSRIEGVVLASIYGFFTLVFGTYLYRQHRAILKQKTSKQKGAQNITLLIALGKIFVAVAVVFVMSGRLIADITALAQVLHLHTFFISLFLVSFGTNIPELSIALRSLFVRSKEIALGDYVGSATVNTALIAILAMARGRDITIDMNPLPFLVFLPAGFLFWYFSQTKKELSRKEAVVLLGFYAAFVGLSLWAELK